MIMGTIEYDLPNTIEYAHDGDVIFIKKLVLRAPNFNEMPIAAKLDTLLVKARNDGVAELTKLAESRYQNETDEEKAKRLKKEKEEAERLKNEAERLKNETNADAESEKDSEGTREMLGMALRLGDMSPIYPIFIELMKKVAHFESVEGDKYPFKTNLLDQVVDGYFMLKELTVKYGVRFLSRTGSGNLM